MVLLFGGNQKVTVAMNWIKRIIGTTMSCAPAKPERAWRVSWGGDLI